MQKKKKKREGRIEQLETIKMSNFKSNNRDAEHNATSHEKYLDYNHRLQCGAADHNRKPAQAFLIFCGESGLSAGFGSELSNAHKILCGEVTRDFLICSDYSSYYLKPGILNLKLIYIDLPLLRIQFILYFLQLRI